MKTYINVFAVAITVLMTAACAENVLETAEGYSSEVAFKIDDPQTRSSMTQSLSNFWVADDEIGVLCKQTNPPAENAKYTAKDINGELYFYADTEYEWANESDYHTFSIYYPYGSNVVDEVYRGTLPSVQTAVSDGGVTITGGTVVDDNLLYSRISCRKTYDGIVPIKDMKRQFGVIEFQIICENEELAYESIRSATFFPDNAIPCGDYSFDLNTGEIKWGASTTKSYQVNVSGLRYSETHNAKRSVYMLVPAGTSIYGGYVVEIGDVEYSIERKRPIGSPDKTIGAGEFYTVTFLSSDVKREFTNHLWVLDGKYHDRTYIYCSGSEMFIGNYVLPGDVFSDVNHEHAFVVNEKKAIYENSLPCEETKTGLNTGIIRFGYDDQVLEYHMYPTWTTIYINGVPQSYVEMEDMAWDDMIWRYTFDKNYIKAGRFAKGDILEPANCHVLKPNSTFFIHPYQGATTKYVDPGKSWAGTPQWDTASALILWQKAFSGADDSQVVTYAKFHKPVNLDDFSIYNYHIYCDPLIEIHTGPSYGNALVGLEEGTGTAMAWSWHIWVPHDTYQISRYGYRSGELMSINLGADYIKDEDTTEAQGLFYQWGRKDPFTHPNETRSGEAQQYPEAETSAFYDAYPWQMHRNYWGRSPHSWSYLFYDSDISVSDPCPAGWRVPFTKDIEAHGLTPGHQYLPEFAGRIRGFSLGGYVAEGGQLRDYENGGYYWIASRFYEDHDPKMLVFQPSMTSSGYWTPEYAPLDRFDDSVGAHVRCVRE